MMLTRPFLFVFVFLLIPQSTVLLGDEPLQLGELSFPTSGSDDAQRKFLIGVKLLHNFEYEEARAIFSDCQKIDPRFAMAFWGEAMCLNHPLWGEQDLKAGQAVLKRLASTQIGPVSQREQGFLRSAIPAWRHGLGGYIVSQLLGLEFSDVGSGRRLCGAIDASELLKEAGYFAARSAPDASFNHFGADVGRNAATSHGKITRSCERSGLKELLPDLVRQRSERAVPWPSRRGWLHEDAAWTRSGNDGNANAGGPTTIAG